ncbi:MAG: AzlD domain-containing protein [Coriobacteriales bacterium]|jgi:branched-subunit amino acid transport protein
MGLTDFLIVFLSCAATILVCRVTPIFALRGRELPASAVRALNLIPPATFSALVANDLLEPGMFSEGFWPAALPLVAAAAVLVVGYKTKSLVWCIVVGVGSYAIMMGLSGLF